MFLLGVIIQEAKLCSYLDLEPADKPHVVAAATEKQDGGDSGSSGDLKENAEKLRTQMKKMIKDGKRLLGIIKMIDGDGSGRLNESEFNKLCKKVLKKQKEVVTSPELLAICWGDVQKLSLTFKIYYLLQVINMLELWI